MSRSVQLTSPDESLSFSRLDGRSVCITGASGRLGRALLTRALEAGAARVVACLRTSTRTALPTDPRLEHVVVALGDPVGLRTAFEGCDVVMHLAGLSNVADSFANPARYFEVNALGTVHVAQAAAGAGVRHTVLASSGQVYGIPRMPLVDEEHPTRPLTPYGASKLAAEAAMCVALAAGGQVTIIRLANIYGPGLAEDTVVGDAVRQARHEVIRLRNLASVRDFIYIDDAVEGMLRLATRTSGLQQETVNLSSGKGLSVGEIAHLLAELSFASTGVRPSVVQAEQYPRELIPRLVLANRRLVELTGWSPPITAYEGLRQTLLGENR